MTDVLALRGSFPIKRETCFLTQLNRLDDGTEYRLYEQTQRLCRWDFDLRNATPEQAAQIEDFFLRLQGRYGAFAFLDPLENLLRWSEDFAQSEWEKSNPAAVRFDGQLSDPLGGFGAQRWSNTAAPANRFTQWFDVPAAGLELTASIWAKAASPCQFVLAVLADGAEAFESSVELAPEWRRCSLQATFSGLGTALRIGFRFELPPNGTVDLFGAQLMALPAPGDYTQTAELSGFHPRCRFASDTLAMRFAAPGVAQTKVSIVEFA